MNVTHHVCVAPARSRVGGFASALLIVALAIIGACSGATDPVANLSTITYQSTLFALNGSALGAPNAINTPTALTVRADIGYDFDVAFDLNATGLPVILTQRVVGVPLGGAGHQVALQRMSGTFASVLEAPSKGWVADSSFTLQVGEVVAIRAGATSCQYDASPFLYSKMVVDSINVASRQFWLSVVTDPNCGFRSFEPGRPRH